MSKSFRFKPFSRRQRTILSWWTEKSPYHDYDGIIADGAIRSGKTLSMSLSFVMWAMTTYDRQNFGMCGKSIGSLRRNVIMELKRLLPLRGYYVQDRRGDNMLVVRRLTKDGITENYFYMFGGKDESSQDLVQGVTLAGVLLDEVALMPESFVNQATGRCSVEGAKLWFNCNPEGRMHWFKLHWINKHKEKRLLYLHFTMDDNLSLSERTKERYRRNYAGVFYRRYILGLWVTAEGLVYPMFDRDVHMVDGEFPISPRHRYYVSIDYGTVNPFAAGLYDYDPANQRATMIREIYYQGGSAHRVDNEAYYKMLTKMIGDYPIEYIIIDPSASSMIETIQKYGKYLVVKADNDVINGIQDVTKFLNAGALFFHKQCKHIPEEFESYA